MEGKWWCKGHCSNFVVIWEIDRGNNRWICMHSLKQAPPIPFFCIYSLLPIIVIILLLLPLCADALCMHFIYECFCIQPHSFFAYLQIVQTLLCPWKKRNISSLPIFIANVITSSTNGHSIQCALCHEKH